MFLILMLENLGRFLGYKMIQGIFITVNFVERFIVMDALNIV